MTSAFGWSQSSYQFGIIPSVNVNYKLENNWSLNSKLESRKLLQSGDFDGNSEANYEHILTDFSLVAGKKVGFNGKLSGGYLARYRGEQFFHRVIQQYTIVQKMYGFRLAHRFSSDQTFSSSENPTFRLRYRIGSEIPLNGSSLDLKEFYVKLNNEYLNEWQDNEYDLEVRVVPVLGYTISQKNKTEFGLDYRINSFVDSNSVNHRFWLALNWFIEI